MDMVMNHTSDKHIWFVESRSSRDNPYRDWYVWRDGKGQTDADKGTPPNNWQSYFGHSAWQWTLVPVSITTTSSTHCSPDVNWYNPKVHEASRHHGLLAEAAELRASGLMHYHPV